MLALYKKDKLLIFFYTFLIFLLTQGASLAAYDNQVIQMKNCNNPDMGEAYANVNTNDSEIYLDLVDNGIKGYFPIDYKTQGGIYSENITLEKYASTETYASYSEEDDILKVVAKYINNDVVVFPKLKKIRYTLNINKPSSYEHRKIVEKWVAADDQIIFNNDEIYEYKCSEVNFYTAYSSSGSSNTDGYYGIGISFITKDKEYPVIDSVIKNSPADKAGLEKGDKLWDISGIDLFDKDSKYIAKLISEAKSPYVVIYYFDVSRGLSSRVTVKPEMINDQESSSKDKEKEKEKKKKEEERKRQEEEKKKKDEEERKQKEAEKEQLIIQLQNDIDALNKEIEQLEEENKVLNESLNSKDDKLSSNDVIVKENRIYKLFVNVVFTVIVLLIFFITYILIRNNKLIGILTSSKQNKSYSSVKSKETKEEIEKDVQIKKEKVQDDIQDLYEQKSTEEIKISKETVGKDKKDDQKTDQSKNDISKNESDALKQPVSDNSVSLDDNENISEVKIEREKSTKPDPMNDDVYTHFIRDYNETMQNPNSVAQLERKYKIIPLERQSPVSLESNVVLIKSSQSIIKSNFWMCKLNDGKNIVLPGRSLIARSNELMADKGRFGSKIFNGIYQLKAAETFKILEPSYCIEQGAEFIISEMGSLTIDAR